MEQWRQIRYRAHERKRKKEIVNNIHQGEWLKVPYTLSIFFILLIKRRKHIFISFILQHAFHLSFDDVLIFISRIFFPTFSFIFAHVKHWYIVEPKQHNAVHNILHWTMNFSMYSILFGLNTFCDINSGLFFFRFRSVFLIATLFLLNQNIWAHCCVANLFTRATTKTATAAMKAA